MTPDEIAAIRARIKERLQNMPLCATEQPYESGLSPKGRGLPIGWIIIVLVLGVIIAVLRGC
jgi:hypothetical protein